jgi:hypothetical protein
MWRQGEALMHGGVPPGRRAGTGGGVRDGRVAWMQGLSSGYGGCGGKPKSFIWTGCFISVSISPSDTVLPVMTGSSCIVG